MNDLREAVERMLALLDKGSEMYPPVFLRQLWREREKLRAALTDEPVSSPAIPSRSEEAGKLETTEAAER